MDEIFTDVEVITNQYGVRELFSCTSSSSTSPLQIISSIEADSKGQFFATGGVSKFLEIYDFKTFAVKQNIETSSKISCIAWNQFNNSKLYNSDYNGTLSMHDITTGKELASWTGHEKRIWSLDASPIDPNRIVTGSDDCHVKLWAEGSKSSILDFNVRANVCSVRFHPTNSNIVALSAADHRVLLFDLRKSNRPLASEKQHKKSVSYVRFTESGDLVSAATDCSLKLWSCKDFNLKPIRTFTGHVNEKNFVGLSVQDDLYAIGSEDNSVYIYHKYYSQPILKYTIPNKCPLTGDLLPSEPSSFVSSVSWAKSFDSPVLLVANSMGAIRVLSIE